MRPVDVTLAFAKLWSGGRLADDGPDGFRPAKHADGTARLAQGPRFTSTCRTHLYGDHLIGVYPLTSDDTVGWCGVDLDEGDHESLIHAANLATVAATFNIKAWTELSRSKGCHTLIFLTEQTPAALARQAMKAACQIVDAPSREVYPKQVTADGGWGNGLRLPYGKLRPLGRQTVIDTDLGEHPVDAWVQEATAKRTTPTQLEALAAVYQAPQPTTMPRRQPTKTRERNDLIGVAGDIWQSGPRDHDDRSKALFAFAVSALRQGFGTADVEIMVAECDWKWCGKFTPRPDGQQRIRELVEHAETEAASEAPLL